ncbi:MAG: undecaprenyl-diphosphate phosphatase [bacterium]
MSFIEALKFLLLGIVQGITEVLPISSSGHVELFKVLLGVDVEQHLLFLILVNTGSLVAFLIIFARDLYNLVLAFIRYLFVPAKRVENREGFHYVVKLVIASIPAAIVGLTLKSYIDEALNLYGILLSGIGLLATGTILLLTSRLRLHHGNTSLSLTDAALIGVAQAFALIPGLSRSGMTTSTAFSRGIGLNSALKFSFLMYIPVSIGSLIVELNDFLDAGAILPSTSTILSFGTAFVAAIFATYFAYKIIFNIFRSGKLKAFSTYCFAVGLLSIALFIIL